jgi:hypothetical protein
MELRREVVEAALVAHFTAERLARQSSSYVLGTAVPSAALGINAWRPLPSLVTWLAVLGWASCVALAVILAVASERSRARLEALLPQAQRLVHIEFAESGPTTSLSSIWFVSAVAASALLWIHGLRPGLVPSNIVALTLRVWLVLLVAAVASRWQESWER